MACVYQLISPSGKSYIGYTKNDVQTRFKQHVTSWKRWIKDGRPRKHKNGGVKLYYGFNAYHPDEWLYNVLIESEDKAEILLAEDRFINEFDSISNGYNTIPGGFGGTGKKLSEEHKRKIGDARSRYYETDEGKEWLNELGHSTSERMRIKRETTPSKLIEKVSPEATKIKQSENMKRRWKDGKLDGKAHSGWGKSRPESQKEAVRNSLSATWEITYPDGRQIVTNRIKDWAVTEGLHPKYCQSNMSYYGTYKGYKAVKIYDPQRSN